MIQFRVSHFSSDTIFLVLESFFGRSLFWTLGPWFIRRICPFKRHYRRQKGSNDVFHQFSWKLNCSWCWLVDRVRKDKCHRYVLSTLFVILKIIINTKKFVDFVNYFNEVNRMEKVHDFGSVHSKWYLSVT